MKKGESDIVMINGVRDTATGGYIIPIELTDHRVCHILQGGSSLKKYEVILTIADEKSRVVEFSLKTSKKFLKDTQKLIVETMPTGPMDDDIMVAKTVAKLADGMCHVSGRLKPETTSIHSFPALEDSWGETTLTVEEWIKIVDNLL